MLSAIKFKLMIFTCAGMLKPGDDLTITLEVEIIVEYVGKRVPANTPAAVFLPLTELGRIYGSD